MGVEQGTESGDRFSSLHDLHMAPGVTCSAADVKEAAISGEFSFMAPYGQGTNTAPSAGSTRSGGFTSLRVIATLLGFSLGQPGFR